MRLEAHVRTIDMPGALVGTFKKCLMVGYMLIPETPADEVVIENMRGDDDETD